MDFRDYYYTSLPDREARLAFADRVGTSVKYIQTHYMAHPPRKVPKRHTLQRIVSATGGLVTREEVLDHFYPREYFEFNLTAENSDVRENI